MNQVQEKNNRAISNEIVCNCGGSYFYDQITSDMICQKCGVIADEKIIYYNASGKNEIKDSIVNESQQTERLYKRNQDENRLFTLKLKKLEKIYRDKDTYEMILKRIEITFNSYFNIPLNIKNDLLYYLKKIPREYCYENIVSRGTNKFRLLDYAITLFYWLYASKKMGLRTYSVILRTCNDPFMLAQNKISKVRQMIQLMAIKDQRLESFQRFITKDKSISSVQKVYQMKLKEEINQILIKLDVSKVKRSAHRMNRKLLPNETLRQELYRKIIVYLSQFKYKQICNIQPKNLCAVALYQGLGRIFLKEYVTQVCNITQQTINNTMARLNITK